MIVIVQFLRKHRKKWKQISGQTTQYDWHYAQNDGVSTVASKDLTGFQPKTDTGTVYCTIVIKNAIVVTVVMFLHLSVSHSVHRGDVCQTPPPEQTPPCANSPLGRHPPQADPTWQTPTPPPPADGYCSKRYASYWNTFLFFFAFKWHTLTSSHNCCRPE